jgi:hypothetical protein
LLFSGDAHLPAALALGRSFVAPGRWNAGWIQYFPDSTTEAWGLHVHPAEPSFKTVELGTNPGAEDFALIVSVTTDAEPAFSASFQTVSRFRAIYAIRPASGFPALLRAPSAIECARLVADTVRTVPKDLHCRGITHLFLAGPAGLAFLVGQLSNSLGPIQTYEHVDDGAIGHYRPSVMLGPTT